MSKLEKFLVRWTYTCLAAIVLTLAVGSHQHVHWALTLLLVAVVVFLSALAMERH